MELPTFAWAAHTDPLDMATMASMAAGKGPTHCPAAAPDAAGKFKRSHHALRQLAVDAGYSMDGAENRLLERIQEFTVWTARYPVPLNSDSMRPRPTSGGGFAPRTYHDLGEDWPAMRAFFAHFENDLRLHRLQRDVAS